MKNTDKIWIKLMKFGGRIGCHQKSERSFFVKGYQFFVCARCSGVIIGEVIAVILLLFSIHISWYILVLLLGVMGVDWFIQYKELLESTNIRRLITGICGGIGLTYFYFYVIIFLLKITNLIA